MPHSSSDEVSDSELPYASRMSRNKSREEARARKLRRKKRKEQQRYESGSESEEERKASGDNNSEPDCSCDSDDSSCEHREEENSPEKADDYIDPNQGKQTEAKKLKPGQFELPTDSAKIWILTGLPNSGKSYMLKYIMYSYAKLGFFNWGLCFSPTSFNGDYDFLPEQCVKDKFDEDYLVRYIESLKEKLIELKKKSGDPKARLPHNFIIFDDCLGMMGGNKKGGEGASWLNHFYSTARHTSTSLFFLNQYIAAAKNIPTTLRNNTNFSLMWPQPMKNSVSALYGAYGGMYENEQEFKQALLNNRGRQYSCLVYRSGYFSAEETYLRIQAKEIPDDFKLHF